MKLHNLICFQPSIAVQKNAPLVCKEIALKEGLLEDQYLIQKIELSEFVNKNFFKILIYNQELPIYKDDPLELGSNIFQVWNIIRLGSEYNIVVFVNRNSDNQLLYRYVFYNDDSYYYLDTDNEVELIKRNKFLEPKKDPTAGSPPNQFSDDYQYTTLDTLEEEKLDTEIDKVWTELFGHRLKDNNDSLSYLDLDKKEKKEKSDYLFQELKKDRDLKFKLLDSDLKEIQKTISRGDQQDQKILTSISDRLETLNKSVELLKGLSNSFDNYYKDFLKFREEQDYVLTESFYKALQMFEFEKNQKMSIEKTKKLVKELKQKSYQIFTHVPTDIKEFESMDINQMKLKDLVGLQSTLLSKMIVSLLSDKEPDPTKLRRKRNLDSLDKIVDSKIRRNSTELGKIKQEIENDLNKSIKNIRNFNPEKLTDEEQRPISPGLKFYNPKKVLKDDSAGIVIGKNSINFKYDYIAGRSNSEDKEITAGEPLTPIALKCEDLIKALSKNKVSSYYINQTIALLVNYSDSNINLNSEVSDNYVVYIDILKDIIKAEKTGEKEPVKCKIRKFLLNRYYYHNIIVSGQVTKYLDETGGDPNSIIELSEPKEIQDNYSFNCVNCSDYVIQNISNSIILATKLTDNSEVDFSAGFPEIFDPEINFSLMNNIELFKNYYSDNYLFDQIDNEQILIDSLDLEKCIQMHNINSFIDLDKFDKFDSTLNSFEDWIGGINIPIKFLSSPRIRPPSSVPKNIPKTGTRSSTKSYSSKSGSSRIYENVNPKSSKSNPKNKPQINKKVRTDINPNKKNTKIKWYDKFFKTQKYIDYITETDTLIQNISQIPGWRSHGTNDNNSSHKSNPSSQEPLYENLEDLEFKPRNNSTEPIYDQVPREPIYDEFKFDNREPFEKTFDYRKESIGELLRPDLSIFGKRPKEYQGGIKLKTGTPNIDQELTHRLELFEFIKIITMVINIINLKKVRVFLTSSDIVKIIEKSREIELYDFTTLSDHIDQIIQERIKDKKMFKKKHIKSILIELFKLLEDQNITQVSLKDQNKLIELSSRINQIEIESFLQSLLSIFNPDNSINSIGFKYCEKCERLLSKVDSVEGRLVQIDSNNFMIKEKGESDELTCQEELELNKNQAVDFLADQLSSKDKSEIRQKLVTGMINSIPKFIDKKLENLEPKIQEQKVIKPGELDIDRITGKFISKQKPDFTAGAYPEHIDEIYINDKTKSEEIETESFWGPRFVLSQTFNSVLNPVFTYNELINLEKRFELSCTNESIISIFDNPPMYRIPNSLTSESIPIKTNMYINSGSNNLFDSLEIKELKSDPDITFSNLNKFDHRTIKGSGGSNNPLIDEMVKKGILPNESVKPMIYYQDSIMETKEYNKLRTEENKIIDAFKRVGF